MVSFFNGGGLNNSDIRWQFLHVLCNLEIINRKVLGFVTDANSNNVTAMQTMSQSNCKPNYNAPVLTEKEISVVNPCSTKVRIYFFLCSTHQLKNMRNALQSSRVGGKRKFICKNGFPFGWEYLKSQLERDQERASPFTTLSQDAVNGLDGWARMNVALAKAPFDSKTIAEALCHICNVANIEVPIITEKCYINHPKCYQPTLSSTFTNTRKPSLIGTLTVKYEYILEKLTEKKNDIEDKYDFLMPQMSTVEYQIVIHEIFLEVLMCKELHICQNNINGIEQFLHQRMTYFTKWKNSVEDKNASNFIAPVTWQNLKMTIYGFIGYSKQVLKLGIEYIPMLHLNTSVLEATFSSIRALGGRDAISYGSRLSCRSATNAMDNLDKGGAYSSNYVLDNEDTVEEIRNFDKCVILGMNNDIRKKNVKK